MRLAFRVDASVEMGSGHLMRCLSLGQTFLELGWEVLYVVRPLDSVADKLLAEFPVSSLAWLRRPAEVFDKPRGGAPAHYLWAKVDQLQDATETVDSLTEFRPDWVIVDHYSFDKRWHEEVASALRCKVGAIDDLGDRDLDVRVLVDPNWDANHSMKYEGRLASNTTTLFGPRFALLSNAYRDGVRYRYSEEVRSIGIFFGGTDVDNCSLLALKACLNEVRFAGDIEVLVRSTSPHLQCLKEYCSPYENVKITVDLPNLAAFFSRHDVQIGAGGGATWERCCVGVPSVLVAFAENQRHVVGEVVALGLAAGVDSIDEIGIARALQSLIGDAPRRKRMAQAGPALVDGLGCLRVALALSGNTVALRDAVKDDAEKVFEWRNAESTRRYFRDPSPIDLSSHIDWWQRTLTQPDRCLLIGAVAGHDVGVVRLDFNGKAEAEVSIYVAPEMTGLGLGVALLRATTAWVEQKLHSVSRLRADIDPENRQSAHAFKTAGYSQDSSRSWSMEL